MLAASATRILERLGAQDLVLDVGAWGKPFTRADWVLDFMPYETRGLYGRDGPEPERFSADTWVVRDICDREPWPFEDDEFDFVICSHTLEDVRDPIWVCSEIMRVGTAGYIEVPSRLEEQSYGFQGPWVGWGHHHWLIDVDRNSIRFLFKHHILHGKKSHYFPRGFHKRLSVEKRVETLWWEGAFEYEEKILMTVEELDSYLGDFVARNLPLHDPIAPKGALRRMTRRFRGR